MQCHTSNRSNVYFIYPLLFCLTFPTVILTQVHASDVVSYKRNLNPGTIVIATKERRLYFVQKGGTALRYKVGVGRPDKQWIGTVQIDGMHIDPDWSPPEEIRRDNPALPDIIPSSSSSNPLGPRALTLSGGGQYAIHGTNRPNTVGAFASYGCFRMKNEDIIDLFSRVKVGTTVVVGK